MYPNVLSAMKQTPMKGDTPTRTHSVLVIEPAQSWERLEGASPEFFYENLDELLQANGFYDRALVTRCGRMDLRVPRTRSALFHSQVMRRYQRRDKAVDEAIKGVFLRGVSTRQAGPALAGLLDEAVRAWIGGEGRG
jgi:putative transposase